MSRHRLFYLAAILATVAISWSLLAHSVLAAGSADKMVEPLFGILYNPEQVVFDKAPGEVFQCSDLRDPPRKLFLFGKASMNDKRFYFVYGLLRVQPDAATAVSGEFEAESDDGIIVVVSPSGCKNIGAGYAFSPKVKFRDQARKIGIDDDVLNRLLADAVDREVKAFGGYERFLSCFNGAGVDETTLHPQLRAKLALIRKKASGNSQ